MVRLKVGGWFILSLKVPTTEKYNDSCVSVRVCVCGWVWVCVSVRVCVAGICIL